MTTSVFSFSRILFDNELYETRVISLSVSLSIFLKRCLNNNFDVASLVFFLNNLRVFWFDLIPELVYWLCRSPKY